MCDHFREFTKMVSFSIASVLIIFAEKEVMKVYEAIKKMRELSERKIPFSFSFMSFSIDKQKSEGIVEVQNAILYKNPKESRNAYADYMLMYRDTDTGEVRQCWQPLVMTFNNMVLESID